MKKIICIGELGLDVVLAPGSERARVHAGGAIALAAARLARSGCTALMASEAGVDAPGELVVGYLEAAGVDTSCVDRFTEGRTPVNFYTEGDPRLWRYDLYRDECFDIVWPRLEEGDIVAFGDHYALDKRMRTRLCQFLTNCTERKTTAVYIPAYSLALEPRITRVMPEVLENLEFASVVLATDADLQAIFGCPDAAKCYREHIGFYDCTLIAAALGSNELSVCTYGGTATAQLPVAITQELLPALYAGVLAAVSATAPSAPDFNAAVFESVSKYLKL